MNLKTELIALAVRVLATKTSLVYQPTPFESLFGELFAQESYDVRVARNIEAEATRAYKSAKKMKLDYQFKKVTKNF